MKLNIITGDSPDFDILRQVAAEVPTPGYKQWVPALVQDMRDTMAMSGGVGLAAPQVGLGWRIIVAGTRALANPRITSYGQSKAALEEGCLSLPGLSRVVLRPTSIVVEALDIDEDRHVIIATRGTLARIIQHEVDHLNGVLITDRNLWSWEESPLPFGIKRRKQP